MEGIEDKLIADTWEEMMAQDKKNQSFEPESTLEELTEITLRHSAWLFNHWELRGDNRYEQELIRRGITPKTNKEARQEWKK